ncbi:MAG: DUF6352 family protein [Geminicoccaceae bacterium]|nr:DUF6352 family protein [Geminicoccaceae bacterium]MCS7268631.1 DUF6352 family protein [Geminicoccaceae bacterium]MCX7629307.1 DUF6352 family protein [Geminicoccaceae bacterium]MDW8125360.1 DUF6352 family protein [Geminicoccaceae bacterium]MDW8341872.1 DUF6352 family protein [Geminicoccaceae bacterium]
MTAPDFWRTSGWKLLARDDAGRHHITDAFLAAWLHRPELVPPEDACPAERALHRALLEQPRRPVTPVALVAIRDPDARENWEVFAAFRDHLLAHPTLEDAYLALFLGEVRFPALFLDQIVHALLRGILDGTEDPFRVRAAECLFREQRVTIREGAVLLADAETIEFHARTGGFGGLGALLREAGAPMRAVELDVLTAENAQGYWARSDRFDTVLDLTFGREGLDALCRVLEAWIGHMLGVATRIQPVQRIRDERWSWHVGLDAEATAILNDLWEGREVEEDRLSQLLALFRLEFRDPSVVLPALRGKPVYLALARDARGRVRLKPQNLLVNLPLAEAG